MQVIKHDDTFELGQTQSVVSIGNYDGVHIGHRYILNELVSKSRQGGCKSIVVTFKPHPKRFFSKNAPSFLLTSFDEKIDIISTYPIDYLVYFTFDEAFASVSAADFVNNILVNKLKVREVIVGYDFFFGKGRSGNTSLLKRSGEKNDFDVTIIDARKIDDEPVSSTRIRKMLLAGSVRKAAEFLGRRYSLTGAVVKGKDIGRKIGYPTANVSAGDKIIPADGVYSVRLTIQGNVYQGVANIGYQPTFGENKRSVEAHILNFNMELHGKSLTMEFVDRLRDERKFQSVRALTDQIKNDIESARASLTSI